VGYIFIDFLPSCGNGEIYDGIIIKSMKWITFDREELNGGGLLLRVPG
jgi:hypothetical protein